MAYISLTYEYADGTKIHARAQSVGLQCLSDRDDDDDD